MTVTAWTPAYISAIESGSIRERIDAAVEALAECRLCPRDCGVNRTAGETGVCQTGRQAVVASFGPHFGEESPLVGREGSGTIFFASCNLLCAFCQNEDISHGRQGQPVTPEQLAGIMMLLAQRGCHNINFVTPSHMVPQILEAIPLAAVAGLRIPLVFNTGGYDNVSTLKLLDGVFDIFMPDLKFMDADPAGRYCDAPDYPEVVQSAIAEMHRQVGDLVIEQGVARRGLLVRHLVMPNGLAGTRAAMRFLASLSKNTYVNVMSQYRPCHEAHRDAQINRRPTRREMAEAFAIAQEEGITRLDERRLPPGWC